jgi:hypothetical protein
VLFVKAPPVADLKVTVEEFEDRTSVSPDPSPLSRTTLYRAAPSTGAPVVTALTVAVVGVPEVVIVPVTEVKLATRLAVVAFSTSVDVSYDVLAGVPTAYKILYEPAASAANRKRKEIEVRESPAVTGYSAATVQFCSPPVLVDNNPSPSSL